LVGTENDSNPAVAAYHRLLVWDIEKAPKVTRYADRVLNPLVGKSLVVYLVKPDEERAPSQDAARSQGAARSHEAASTKEAVA
jgi:hypothetical protein